MAKYFVIIGVLLLVPALALLFLIDPAGSRLFPPCPLHLITGYYCPGCGSLRATHLLLHGHIAAACKMNPILMVAAPVLGILFIKPSWAYQVWMPWTALLVLMSYGVLRNVPTWPFILLAPR
jgi:hypothetical protein